MSTHTVPLTHRPTSAAPGPVQRAGGIASLVVGGSYVAGFGLMVAYLLPAGFTGALTDPAGSLAFLQEHRVSLYLWYLTLYVIGGVAMAVVALGVAERLRAAPGGARACAAFGLLWAGLLLASGMVALVGQGAVVELAGQEPELARSVWASASLVQEALGGGIEVVGACWVLLVGAVALRTRALSRGLAWTAVGVSSFGFATLLPWAVDSAASGFGLGLIIWFVWAGVELRRP